MLKIMLVDDHEVVRAGYRRLLENTGEMQVVAEAASGEEAYQLYQKIHPQVVVMDLSMPGMGGLETIRRLLVYDPKAKILVFSVHENEIFLRRALDAGALGYLTKRSASQTMVAAVHQIAQGKPFIGQEMLPYLMKRVELEDNTVGELSPREFEIFLLLAEGKSVNEIADTINLSPKTVSNHLTNIKNKLNVASIAELTRLAIRRGLLEP